MTVMTNSLEHDCTRSSSTTSAVSKAFPPSANAVSGAQAHVASVAAHVAGACAPADNPIVPVHRNPNAAGSMLCHHLA